MDAVRLFRIVLKPAFTWGKGDIDVLPVHDLFLVSTLTITFGQVSASFCSLYVAEI
jgi:hypothetical protein